MVKRDGEGDLPKSFWNTYVFTYYFISWRWTNEYSPILLWKGSRFWVSHSCCRTDYFYLSAWLQHFWVMSPSLCASNKAYLKCLFHCQSHASPLLSFAAQSQMRKILVVLLSSLLIKKIILIRLKHSTWRIFIFLYLIYTSYMLVIFIYLRGFLTVFWVLSVMIHLGRQRNLLSEGKEPSSNKETIFLAFVKQENWRIKG